MRLGRRKSQGLKEWDRADSAASFGDTITLALGAARPSFRIVDVFYDYGSERGSILMDRQTMLRYLPDPAPSNLAIYVAPNSTSDTVRKEIIEAAASYRVLLFS